jgi:type IV pilus assembly protein PilQ
MLALLLFANPGNSLPVDSIVSNLHSIKQINYKKTDKNGWRIIFSLSDEGVPIKIHQYHKSADILFKNTNLPVLTDKAYDVENFPVEIMVAGKNKKDVRVRIKNKAHNGYFAYQQNKQFFVDIFPYLEGVKSKEQNLEGVKSKEQKNKSIFNGKKITLNFQDIPVRSVLSLLAEFANIDIVVSDSVSGNMALNLHEIPWDQVLDIILTTQNLEKKQIGNVILIDTISSFADRQNQALLERRAAEHLALIRSEIIQINYAKAADIASILKDKDNSILTERGKVSVDARTNNILLQDRDNQIEEIKSLIRKLDIPVKQVLIEARIVNVRKGCAEDIGIRFGVIKANHLGGTLEGLNGYSGTEIVEDVPITDRLNVDLGALPIDASPASVGIALAKLGNGVLLDLELSALESEGRAEIIASPRLMTTNQQTAVIESGEDIPYQEASSSGATAVSFKKAVLSLKVTPQITPDGKLLMDLLINQDADSGRRVQGVPIILTKSIETNVLVNNGQTIVLGGIYKQDKNSSVTRVPLLGHLPLVGHLFSRRQVRESNEELLIFITPRIFVNNLSNQAGELDKFGKSVELPSFEKAQTPQRRLFSGKLDS